MSEIMVCDIADLFGHREVTRDATGSLRFMAALLDGCSPVLLFLAFLAEESGNAIVEERITPEVTLPSTEELLDDLLERLGDGADDADGADDNIVYHRVSCGEESCLAFAFRIRVDGESGILGGVVRDEAAFLAGFPGLRQALSVCGQVAWVAFREQSRNATLHTQLQHLINEKDTLKISHTKAVSNALEEHEARLRDQQENLVRLEKLHLQNKMILHSAGEGILGLNRDGLITFVNPAGAKMVGWSPEELIGREHHAMFHHTKRNGKSYEVSECPIRITLLQGTIGTANNEIFWRKDGSSFPVEYTNTPILQDDEIMGAVLTFRDITKRRALEQQLVQAQKLESIGQLAAGIAHEINTPTQYIGDNTRFFKDALKDLSVVIEHFEGLLEAAKQKTITDTLIDEVQATIDQVDVHDLTEEMASAVDQSLEGVNWVASIVRSMKEFSHPGTEEKRAVDLNRALQNTLTVSRNEWKYVADTVTNFDPALPPVYCLPGECNQVFLNLIVNAAHAIADKVTAKASKTGKTMDAMDAGIVTERGTITLTTSHDDRWVEIRVQDSGTGIPEEARNRVWDPFFTTKEVGRGTGQGLAIARSVIVEKHGGELTFETEMGKGTTFVVRLPIENDSSCDEGTAS